MLLLKLTFLFYLINTVLFVITDDTTFGIWMILFTIILYGEAFKEAE